MSIWNSPSGKPITGNEDDSFAGSFELIPNGTTARATIKNFILDEYDPMMPLFQVTWKLIDGEYAGQEVRQKIACFDVKPEKKERALNMLMRFYVLLGIKNIPDSPHDDDLKIMKGKVLGIKIQEWHMNDKSGNWVSEIHPPTNEFVTETGVKIVIKEHHDADSALSRNAQMQSDLALDNEIPF